jgi:repressor LexA
MREPLTARQREVLEFIRFKAQHSSSPPSVREIGQAVGLSSSSTVQNHLNTLERKGYIRRNPSKSRSIELVLDDEMQAKMRRVQPVPLVGRIAAGAPILAEQNIEDYLMLPAELAGDDQAFALTVQGDSMVGDGILEGDVVVVRPAQQAPNGTIVAALVGDEATVKRFYHEGDRVRLQPANERYQPLYPDSVTILGRVVGVVRHIR